MFFIILLFLGAALQAQTLTGSAEGTVRDQSGALLQEAAVTLKNLDTGYTRAAVTDREGRFRAVALPLGPYRAEAGKAGFLTQVREEIELTVDGTAALDFQLQVGTVQGRVDVVASVSEVDLHDSALNQLVDARKIAALPLNGRDITQLMQLQAGVVAARTDNDGDIVTGSKGTRIVVGGSRPSTNVYMVDGTVVNNLGNRVAGGATGNLTGVETIREFRAYTNNYNAEFGRATGGVFSVITKSGTNTLHGSAFEYLRNDNLDARNFFDGAKQPEFRRNQFGGSIGGPLVKNRTFFFASYEGFREQTGETITRTVPDLNARSGLVGQEQLTVNPVIRPYLDLWPLPTSDPVAGDGSALYTTVFTRPVEEDYFNVRLDQTISPADSLLLRYTISDSAQEYINQELFPQFANRLTNRPQSSALQETHVFSANTVNVARFGFARSNPFERTRQNPLHPELAFLPAQSFGTINLSGFDLFGTDGNLPRVLTQNSFQFGDQFTWTTSRHTFSTGIQVERLQSNVNSPSRLRGEYRFTSLRNLVRGVASQFDGMVPSAQDATRGYRQTLVGWYLQDSIRLLPRLVVNLGVRHEFVTVPIEHRGRMNNLHHYMDAAVTVGEPFKTSKAWFAPRVGFALDPFGDGKTSIRGGIGLFTVPFLSSTWFNSIVRLPPYAVTARATGAAVQFPNGLSGLAAQGSQSVSGVDYNHEQPYMLHYNFNLQREVAEATVVTLAYVGSRGRNLGREADFNNGPLGSGTRRNPNFSRIRFRTWDAASSYNGLQATLQRRFFAGAQLQVSYTFSKSIDDASSEVGRTEFNNGQARTSDPFNLAAERSLSSFDIRHHLTGNFTWEMPWRARLGGWLLDEWQVNGIVTLSSGVPFTPVIMVDLDRDGTDDNEQRPNLRPGWSNNPVLGRPEQWFDPAAFSSIETGTRGNLGRNTIFGPGLATFDAGLTKEFLIPRQERVRLQFRAEFYNLTNRTNFATPPRSSLEIFNEPRADAPPLPNVGRITSTSTTARQIQLALRLTF